MEHKFNLRYNTPSTDWVLNYWNNTIIDGGVPQTLLDPPRHTSGIIHQFDNFKKIIDHTLYWADSQVRPDPDKATEEIISEAWLDFIWD